MDNYLSVKFLKQPASKTQFRQTNKVIYNFLAGPKLGTFPTIQIAGPAGFKLVVIQLVSKNEPFRPHPFALIGKRCENGVYTHHVNKEFRVLKLDRIGIQFFTPDENEKALEFRKNNNMDPFGTGFSTSYIQTMDYFRLRLCVTVKIIESEITETIISDPIHDIIKNRTYFRMRAGLLQRPNTYERPQLKILSQREVSVRSFERTDANSNNFPAAVGNGTTHRIELLDRIQRRNYNRQLRRNMVSPLPMRRNLNRSNLNQSFPNSSALPETLYPISDIIMIAERVSLIIDFNLLQINIQPNEPPIGPQSNLSNMFNSMNLN